MTQPSLGLVILYVESPARSAGFYAEILGLEPAEASATFVLFRLPSGMALGLWSRPGVEPAAEAGPGGGELAFIAPDVDAVHADWVRRGITVIHGPDDLDFGRAFTAQDPDGHRLRVFSPAGS